MMGALRAFEYIPKAQQEKQPPTALAFFAVDASGHRTQLSDLGEWQQDSVTVARLNTDCANGLLGLKTAIFVTDIDNAILKRLQ